MQNSNDIQMESTGLRYEQTPWGELIYGTKEELQRLGIGKDCEFPIGRRRLEIVDPRGFKCTIRRDRWHGEEQFSAAIVFPGREQIFGPAESFAPGVTCERLHYADLYRGTLEALTQPGLVRAAQFPGAPGIGKTVAAFDASGNLVPSHLRPRGGVTIRRASTRLFNVYFYVDADEEDRRWQSERSAREEYERRMAALPRPSPLVAPDRETAAKVRRADLRLAWSRPLSTFTLHPPEAQP